MEARKTYNGHVIAVTVLGNGQYNIAVSTSAGTTIKEVQVAPASIDTALTQVKAAIDAVVDNLTAAQAALDTW